MQRQAGAQCLGKKPMAKEKSMNVQNQACLAQPDNADLPVLQTIGVNTVL